MLVGIVLIILRFYFRFAGFWILLPFVFATVIGFWRPFKRDDSKGVYSYDGNLIGTRRGEYMKDAFMYFRVCSKPDWFGRLHKEQHRIMFLPMFKLSEEDKSVVLSPDSPEAKDFDLPVTDANGKEYRVKRLPLTDEEIRTSRYEVCPDGSINVKLKGLDYTGRYITATVLDDGGVLRCCKNLNLSAIENSQVAHWMTANALNKYKNAVDKSVHINPLISGKNSLEDVGSKDKQSDSDIQR